MRIEVRVIILAHDSKIQRRGECELRYFEQGHAHGLQGAALLNFMFWVFQPRKCIYEFLGGAGMRHYQDVHPRENRGPSDARKHFLSYERLGSLHDIVPRLVVFVRVLLLAIMTSVDQPFVGNFDAVFSHILLIQRIQAVWRPEIPKRHLPQSRALFVVDQTFVSEAAITLFAQAPVQNSRLNSLLTIPHLLAYELLIELTNLAWTRVNPAPIVSLQPQMRLPQLVIPRLAEIFVFCCELVLVWTYFFQFLDRLNLGHVLSHIFLFENVSLLSDEPYIQVLGRLYLACRNIFGSILKDRFNIGFHHLIILESKFTIYHNFCK